MLEILDNMAIQSIGILAGLLGLTGLSAGYSYGTKFEKEITIDEKFERIRGNKESVKQIFSVADTENNVYKVSHSLWYWQWYSTETWNSLKKGENYRITGYGIRSGPLSLYPNIINAQHIPKSDMNNSLIEGSQ